MMATAKKSLFGAVKPDNEILTQAGFGKQVMRNSTMITVSFCYLLYFVTILVK